MRISRPLRTTSAAALALGIALPAPGMAQAQSAAAAPANANDDSYAGNHQDIIVTPTKRAESQTQIAMPSSGPLVTIVTMPMTMRMCDRGSSSTHLLKASR